VWVDQLDGSNAIVGSALNHSGLSHSALADGALSDLVADGTLVGASIVTASIQHAGAVARWALARQAEIGDRFRIAVIAAGEPTAGDAVRFAVEDLLGAGAIVDALASVGIDYYSPEAAAASAAYTGLRSATAHVVSASTSGQALGRPKISLEVIDHVDVVRE
jgi:phosphosulfolactate phosphohydrolase-like enzyme